MVACNAAISMFYVFRNDGNACNGQEDSRHSLDIPFEDTRRIIWAARLAQRARDSAEGDIRVQGTFLIDLGSLQRQRGRGDETKRCPIVAATEKKDEILLISRAKVTEIFSFLSSFLFSLLFPTNETTGPRARWNIVACVCT